MDSSRSPNSIGREKVAFARNVTFRNGFPATRPGWSKRPITFEDVDTQTDFETGYFQGAHSFEPHSGGNNLIVSVGGRIFKIDTTSLVCNEVTGSDTNPSTRTHAWMEQAE